jgi:hypothetical protein
MASLYYTSNIYFSTGELTIINVHLDYETDLQTVNKYVTFSTTIIHLCSNMISKFSEYITCSASRVMNTSYVLIHLVYDCHVTWH